MHEAAMRESRSALAEPEVSNRPAIRAEIDGLDKALAILSEAIDYAADRVERLEHRIAPVLGPTFPSMAETVAGAREGERDVVSPLAEEVAAKTSFLLTLADRIRGVGRHADHLGDRVEL